MIFEMSRKMFRASKGALNLMMVIILAWSCTQNVEPKVLPTFSCTNNVPDLELVEYQETMKGDSKSSSGMPINRIVPYLGKDCLIEFNPTLNSLDVYDLTQFKLIKRINYELDGPDLLPNTLDFYWHSKDSIFFLGEGGILSLMTDNGKLVNRVIIGTKLPNGHDAGDYFAEPTMGLRMDYIPHIKSIQLYAVMIEGNEDYSHSLPFIANYSLQKKKIVNVFGAFPDVFFQGKHFSLLNDPSKIVVKNKTILSFGPDQGVYIYDSFNGDIEQVNCAKSKLFSRTEGLPHAVAEYQDLINFETTEPWYLKIIHDPYRNRYYRFAKHRQELKDANGKMNPRFLGKWSIIVFDDNFNRIGEVVLPANKYAILSSFVAPKGLMILSLLQSKENEKKYFVLNFK